MKKKIFKILTCGVLAAAMAISSPLASVTKVQAEEEAEELTVTYVAEKFVDVYRSDWFHDSVQYVYDKGLMKGMTNDIFDPCGYVSRAQAAMILYRLGLSPIVSYEYIFADVGNYEWFTNPVMWTYQNNIMRGYGNGFYGPSDMITREQLATALYKYVKASGFDAKIITPGCSKKYVDGNQISAYAVDAIEWCIGLGIMGKSVNTLNPQAPATRAEVAIMLQRMMSHFEYSPYNNYHTHELGLEIPHYLQNDEAWRLYPYGSGTMWDNACGPTAMAMVLSYLVNGTITPLDVVNEIGNKYWKGGTDSWFFTEYARNKGLGVHYLQNDMGVAAEEVRKGHPVILLIKKNNPPLSVPSAGHYVVLRYVDQFGHCFVNDPLHEEYCETPFMLDYLQGAVKEAWSYYR